MKVMILAGGLGSRLSEETTLRPKPMVEICGKPILWHIMKLYSHHGYNDFIILLGYKGYFVKEFFANYFLHQSDVTIDIASNKMEVHNNSSEPWKVTLIDTGYSTMTGGRIKRAQKYVYGETFMLTYGDGVADINIKDVADFHSQHGKIATMTAVQPEGRFGVLDMEADGKVNNFLEKPPGDNSWINAGFFVLSPDVFNYIDDRSDCIFERDPLESLTRDDELFTYRHQGFWKCMDTMRDKTQLEEMWSSNKAKWKVWE